MTTETRRATPPITVVLAFFGFLLSTVTAIASGLLILGARDELATTLRNSDPTLNGERLDQAVMLAQGFALAVVAVLVIGYLWLSFKLKAGRNWARVALTVLTLLQAASLFTGETSWAGYLSCGVAVVAMVLSYLPPSNAYIAGVGRAG
ncbi:hypothetical protein L3Q67_30785 [Saccharothrix sp. AJ9571]|nr:hypothetical protein L3Q67_30785 [Saccharothrix sp. AJ9571]